MLSELRERTAVRFSKEQPLYRGTLLGFSFGIVLTITVALVWKKAMPALLFILPMELLGICAAAYFKFGRAGLLVLIKFDEENALKQGP